MADYTFFEALKDITDRKRELDFSQDDVKKAYVPYMINRYVSMCEPYVPLVNEINKYEIPTEIHHRYYQDMLPKRHVFFNYIKKTKDVTLEDKKYICAYYECSMRDADEYVRILTEEQLQEILSKYKYGRGGMAQV